MSNFQETNTAKNQQRNQVDKLSESLDVSHSHQALPDHTETIGEEFKRLLQGSRLSTTRQAAKQSVQERQRQEQLKQLQEQQQRKASNKPKKKPLPIQKKISEPQPLQQPKPQQIKTSRQTSYPIQVQRQTHQSSQNLLQTNQIVVQTSQQANVKQFDEPIIKVALNTYHTNREQQTKQQSVQQMQKPAHQSPQKIKVKTSTYDKDFTEQLAEYKILDKVLPCLDNVSGVYVQVTKSQEFATVVKRISQNQLLIQTLAGVELEVQLIQVKFLAGAYVQPLSEVVFQSASDPLSIDLVLTENTDRNLNIILIQVISAQIEQDSNSQVPVGSIHRLHALVFNPLTEKFNLYPVQFNNTPKTNKRNQRQILNQGEDPEKDNHQLFAYQNEKITQDVISFARKIQGAFNFYKSNISNILLTPNNYEQLLYSVCKIEKVIDDPSQTKYGVLTRYFNNQAFVRFLRTKAEWDFINTQQWLSLDEYNIYADLSLGFVSLSTLIQRTIFDIKLRNLKFISQYQSLTYSQSQPRQISTSEVCKQCNYVLVDNILHSKNLVCAGCQSFYHEKCLKDYQTKSCEQSNDWFCPSCIKCINCKANSSDLWPCQICNVPYHFDCLDDKYKKQLKPFEQLQLKEFRCENCIKCQACGTQIVEKENQGVKWSADFKFCFKCDQKREAKMYCIGCLKLWDDSIDQNEFLICAGCQMRTHISCDRMLAEPQVLDKLKEKDQDGQFVNMYACFSCRHKARADFLLQIVECMMLEDKSEEFKDKFWEQANNYNYKKVIKSPICFGMIKEEITNFIESNSGDYQIHPPELKYLRESKQFEEEINLIFSNAYQFNQPQSDIHKQAKKLQIKCQQILSQGRISEIIRDNSLITQDELLHIKYVRGISTAQLIFKLKPKDLYQNQEQIDMSSQQFMLKSNEEFDDTILGKRQKEFVHLNIAKRQRIENGEKTFNLDQNLDQVNVRRLFSDKNRMLIDQNLIKIRQTQVNPYPFTEKFNLKRVSNDGTTGQLPPNQKWQIHINNLRMEENTEKCWYGNPVGVSFDDPSLIFEEMCYLCGSFGLREEFLTCNLCCESFHPFCLPNSPDLSKIDTDKWLCYNCLFCEKCHNSKNYESLIICSVCEKSYHFWCLEPRLVSLPVNSWKCKDCFQCRQCGTKEFFSAEDIANKVNLDPNEKYLLSFHFEFCYQCGQDQYRKSFCSICQQLTGLGIIPENFNKKSLNELQFSDNDQCRKIELFKCTTCKFFSHLSCSKTDSQTLDKLSKSQNYKGYQCLECLLANKSPGFYLHEQCEIYEDMHSRLELFELISQLCHTVLQKYSQGNDLILEQYVKQNFNWISSHPLVVKWIQLLRSEVDYETSENSQQIQDQQSQPMIRNFSQGGLEQIKDEFLLQSQSDQTMFVEAVEPRDMYLSLYEKINSKILAEQDLPEIILNEQLLKSDSIDFAELFLSVEMMAILKIRNHFFYWVENSLVGPAIKHQDLFFKQEQNQEQTSSEFQVDVLAQAQVEVDQVMDGQEQYFNEEICTEEDETIVNPQNKLVCILCQQSGEKRMTGRLIPFQVNQFVHVYCALWSSEVKDVEEEQQFEEKNLASELFNLYFSFKAYRDNICAFCGLKGATLICSNHNQQSRKCAQPYFHFPCAYKSKKISFQTNLEVYCEACTKREKSLTVGLPIKFKDYHRRRFIIVKNIKPLETSLFDETQANQAYQNIEAGQITNETQDRQSSATRKIQMQILMKDSEQLDNRCNKWRPFYYDMFNRVGNLTILSLSQQANHSIETLHNQQFQQVLWHDRLKKRSEPVTLNDFASVRISWKDKEKGKGYFLFTSDQVKTLASKEINQLIPYLSKQLLKQQKGIIEFTQQQHLETKPLSQFWQEQLSIVQHHFNNFTEESTYQRPENMQGFDKYPIQWWNDPVAQVGCQFQDLKQANFFYKSAELVIQRQQLFNQSSQADLQVQFDSQKISYKQQNQQNNSQLVTDQKDNFSYANSTTVNYQNQFDGRQEKSGGVQSGDLQNIFKKMLDANKYVDAQGFPADQLEPKVGKKVKNSTVPIELKIKQKLSSLNLKQNVLNQLSAKKMNYDQIMGCLGKLTISQRKILRQRQAQQKNELLIDSDEELGQKAYNQVNQVNEDLRQNFDAQNQSKSVEQNQSMKYRAAKEKMQKVEVWTSKIHRNGLFACQAFNPQEIVIEYVGEKIRHSVADRREKYYEKIGVGDCYLFNLEDKEHVIDATFYGNKARYINHSCEPNLKSENILVDGKPHIIFTALRHIKEGEELTFDYKFEYEANNQLECFCMAENCRGHLN